MTSSRKPGIVLTIAGFDPSCGAGITADLKTIAAHGLYGVACITALTVQTTQGVRRVEPIRPDLVRETLEALIEDAPPAAVKIGMLGSGDVAVCVAELLRNHRLPNVVLDPVLSSSSGAKLLDDRGVQILKDELFGLVNVITPNVIEAAVLCDLEVEDVASMQEACRRLMNYGARNVVVKGGHLDVPTDLLAEGRAGDLEFSVFKGEKIETKNSHGTGCAFSTALACNLALGGSLSNSVREAKECVAGALRSSFDLGKGVGPVNHLYRLQQ